MLTKIEKEYAKHIPEFVKEMHKSIFEKEKMDSEFREKLINSYETCFVGSIRQKLGLSKKYYSSYEHHHNICSICTRAADQLMDIESSKSEGGYIRVLERFKIHLKDEHKKVL